MKRTIQKIAPVQTGKLMAVMYALLSVIIVPFMLLAMFFSPAGQGMGLIMVIIIPIVYIIAGFVGGILVSFVYNLCAGWVGGLEIEVEDKT